MLWFRCAQQLPPTLSVSPPRQEQENGQHMRGGEYKAAHLDRILEVRAGRTGAVSSVSTRSRRRTRGAERPSSKGRRTVVCCATSQQLIIYSPCVRTQLLGEGKSELWRDALWVNDPTPSEERPPDLVRFCAPLDAEDLVQIFFDVDLIDEVFCVPAGESGSGSS